MTRIAIFLALLFILFKAEAQPWMKNIPKQKSSINTENFYDIREAFYKYCTKLNLTDINGWKQFKRWEWFMESRVDSTGYIASGIYWEESLNKQRNIQSKKGTSEEWSFLGPWITPVIIGTELISGAGRIDCIAFHPSDSNIIWIGSPTGGLWKTINGGLSWNTTTDDLGSIGISDIAIHPDNPDTIYIVTGDRDAYDAYSVGILKSTDGGETWQTTGRTYSQSQVQTINRLLINKNSPDTLIVAQRNGIYISSDGGGNWTVAEGTSNIRFKCMEFKPGDYSTIYASKYDYYGDATIYKSIDGGKTFNEASTGIDLDGNIQRIAIAVTPANPDVVYAMCSRADNDGLNAIYKSSDSGQNWTEVFSGNSLNLLGWDDDGLDEGGQGYYDLALAVSPINENEIYTGGINIWGSEDGGSSWDLKSFWYHRTEDPTDFVHADHHALAYGTVDSALYSGNDGGLFKSGNGGNTWTNLSDSLKILQIYRIGTSRTNANLTLTGNQDNGSMKSNNGSWSRIYGGDGMECMVDHLDTNILYTTLYYGELFKSLDGGYTRFNITPSDEIINGRGQGAWITPYLMHPDNPEVIYGGFDNVYKTIDKGWTWDSISSNLTGGSNLRSLAVAKSDDNYIYAATYTKIWRTTDGGNTWNEITANLPVNLNITSISIAQYNPDKVWVSLSGYNPVSKIYYTENGGETWINYSVGMPNVPANCIIYQNNSNHILYTGTDLGVYYRDKTMDQWEEYGAGLPTVIVNDLEIHYSANKLRAGTYGRGLWEADILSSSIYADFLAIETDICTDGSTSFINKSSESPDSIFWDFGTDATPSTAKNIDTINVNFSGSEDKTISLTVYKSGSSDTETKIGYIKYVSEIEVAVSPSYASLEVGDSVKLTASGAFSYLWTPATGLSSDSGRIIYAKPDTTTNYLVTGIQGICTDESTVTVFVSSNNNVCSATLLSLGVNGPFTNQNATVETNEPMPDTIVTTGDACNTQMSWCAEGGLQCTVWFKFIGPESGKISIDTEGMDNQIAVYEADTCSGILNDSYTILAANDDYHGEDEYYAAAIESLSGLAQEKTYWLQVDGSFSGTEGTFFITLEDYPMAVDKNVFSKISSENIQLYPNPNDGSFELYYNSEKTTDIEINIINISGQVIYSRKLKNKTNEFKTRINLGSVPKGLYLIRVFTNYDMLSKKVIIK